MVSTSSDLQPEIRASTDRDEAAIDALFRRVRGSGSDLEERRWKVRLLSPPAATTFIASAGRECIAHYGGSARRVSVEGVFRWAMLGVDGMTDPSRRRRGWFSRVSRAAAAAWRSAGVAFEIGVPSPHYEAHAPALGWEPIATLESWMIPIATLSLAGRQLGRAFERSPAPALCSAFDRALSRVRRFALSPRAIEIAPVSQAGSELDAVWARVQREHEISTIRDRTWIDERFLRAPPERDFRVLVARDRAGPLGWIAFRLGDDGAGAPTGYFSDMAVPRSDRTARHALIEAMIGELALAGALKAHALVLRGSPAARTLRAHGFLLPRGTLTAQVRRFDRSIPLESFTDPERFALSPADFDFG
jgi:GNAT acetyltransferase-like protein